MRRQTNCLVSTPDRNRGHNNHCHHALFQIEWNLLRKLLSILLLFGLSLPFASTLLASGVVPGQGLPMCCRRGGQHQCGMVMAAAAPGEGTQAAAPHERCPWRSTLATAPHSDVFAVVSFRLVAGEALARGQLPSALTRKWSVTESSRTSRGPPSLLPL